MKSQPKNEKYANGSKGTIDVETITGHTNMSAFAISAINKYTIGSRIR